MRKTYNECRSLFMQAFTQQNWNDVAVWSTELLKYDDNAPYVWANRGVAYASMGFHLDAILNYDRAIALENDEEQLAILYSNKGAAYWDMFDADRALHWLNKAIDTHQLPQSYLTRGNIEKHQGRLLNAIGTYRSSIACGPDYVDGHMVLGMALLKSGALQEGWREYAWRWKSPQCPERKMKTPKWGGEDLSDKLILVYGEQGLGDIIQFSRYVRVLGQKFPKAKIIVEGRSPVRRLLETIPEAYAVINVGEKFPHLDYQISMIDLAALLTPSISSIPSAKREFFLKKEHVEGWKQRMSPLDSFGKFRVGICWAGMSRDDHPSAKAIDVLRSTTLDKFAPLAKIPNIVWVSLQKGPPAEQAKTPPLGMTLGDFSDDMYDFYETCCVIENCDLVISVDTAVLHAAASLGKRTWLLSRWDGCWRWFGDRSLSPWYPSLRQFVQPKFEDWDGMMEKVAVELAELVKHERSIAAVAP